MALHNLSACEKLIQEILGAKKVLAVVEEQHRSAMWYNPTDPSDWSGLKDVDNNFLLTPGSQLEAKVFEVVMLLTHLWKRTGLTKEKLLLITEEAVWAAESDWLDCGFGDASARLDKAGENPTCVTCGTPLLKRQVSAYCEPECTHAYFDSVEIDGLPTREEAAQEEARWRALDADVRAALTAAREGCSADEWWDDEDRQTRGTGEGQ